MTRYFAFLSQLGPFLASLAAIVLVVTLLIAFPLFTAALGFSVPFLVLGAIGYVAFMLNLRWSLWNGTRPLFFAIADLGFLACLTAFAFYGFASVASTTQAIPYVAGGGIAAALVRTAFVEFEAWLLGVIFSILLAVVFRPYILFTLPHPEWFFDFMASLLLVVSIGLIFVGSSLSFLESKRGKYVMGRPGWFHPLSFAGVLGLLATGIASAALTLGATGSVEAIRSYVVLPAEDIGVYNHLWGTLPEGPVAIVVRNPELLVHTFTIEELSVDVLLGPGDERLVEFEAVGGQYAITCRVPGQNSWRGSLLVE